MSDLIYREDAKDFVRHALANGLDAIEYLNEVPEADCQATNNMYQPYLFVFDDGTTYEMSCGISLKDAIWEMAKYTGNASEMLRKSLIGFTEADVDDMVRLFNHLCNYSGIKSVYLGKSYTRTREVLTMATTGARRSHDKTVLW